MKKLIYLGLLLILFPVIAQGQNMRMTSGGQTLAISSLQKGLIGHWSLAQDNLIDSNTFGDKTPQGNNGDSALTVIFGTDSHGQTNQAMVFNGGSSYINIVHNSNLPLYEHITYSISMWVKGLAQSDRRIFTEGSSSSNDQLFALGTVSDGSSNHLRVLVRNDDATTTLDLESTIEVFDNTWHHVTWTDDNGTASLYIDGVLDGTDFSYVRGILTLDRTTIGALGRVGTIQHFGGTIFDIHIYNCALSSDEITVLYEQYNLYLALSN